MYWLIVFNIQPQKIVAIFCNNNKNCEIVFRLFSSHPQIKCYKNPVTNSGYEWVKYFWNPEEYLRFLLFFKEHYLVKAFTIDEFELLPKWFWKNENFSYITFCDENIDKINKTKLLKINYNELIDSLSPKTNFFELSSHFSNLICNFLDIQFKNFFIFQRYLNTHENALKSSKKLIVLSENSQNLQFFCRMLSSHPDICAYIEPLNSPLFIHIEDYWNADKFIKFLLFNDEGFDIKVVGIKSPQEKLLNDSFFKELRYLLIGINENSTKKTSFSESLKFLKKNSLSYLPLSINDIYQERHLENGINYLNENISLKICNFLKIEPFIFYSYLKSNP